MSASLSGCVGLAVGAGATAGTAALQDRGLGGAIDDTVIHGKITSAYLSNDVKFKLIAVKVHEGRVLLTGNVPKPEDRVEAVRHAWKVEGVKTVINEITVEDDSGVLDLARDKWVSTQLRLKITFDGKIKAINYAIDTVNGTVYLMGIAQNERELALVRNHARSLDYVRRVVSHVRIKRDGTT
ncbi:MAG: BON domain-containing protein [Rhodospirillaceae bacterium]|nr:BON domain-containing protein [Rhodospirillaceae bacterium]MDD9917656.1 BON domain-containing protein [Rhodospirillaceae bacterium]MDD9929782.1 BON domain-containing protein [Rhodospirillaceae bacterium]